MDLHISLTTSPQHNRPVAASVPPLGLSNKAVHEGKQPRRQHRLDLTIKIAVVLIGETDPSRAPYEGELASTTLWPETEKIFGHGYEVRFLSRERKPCLIQ
jgi:elongator complex protein 2